MAEVRSIGHLLTYELIPQGRDSSFCRLCSAMLLSEVERDTWPNLGVSDKILHRRVNISVAFEAEPCKVCRCWGCRYLLSIVTGSGKVVALQQDLLCPL